MPIINPNQALDISVLTENLKLATKEFLSAKEAERDAGKRATDSLNRLNMAQKTFNDAFKALQDAAPSESDWKRKTVRGEAT